MITPLDQPDVLGSTIPGQPTMHDWDSKEGVRQIMKSESRKKRTLDLDERFAANWWGVTSFRMGKAGRRKHSSGFEPGGGDRRHVHRNLGHRRG